MDTPQRPSSQAPGGHTGAVTAIAKPHLVLLHGAMLLSGFGTVFLGPVLPTLAAAAHTTDSGSGLFFTAQFIGAFLGGVTTSERLWHSLLRGCTAAALGFLLLAVCVSRQASLPWHAAVLLPLGFGVGQMLTSVNLLASRRFVEHRGSALSLVNFSWSLGAVLAPFLLGNVLRRIPLQFTLASAGCLFLLALAGTAWNARRRDAVLPGQAMPGQTSGALGVSVFVYFAALLFIYGGVETSLSGWTTTFGQRYGSTRAGTGGLAAGAVSTTALWLGLTAGRVLVALLLRVMRERALLIASLTAATLLTIALSRSSGGASMVLVCALLGLSLAPWFPVVLATMLAAGAAAHQVGSIIAVSGIGAAVLPLLVGALSRYTASLRLALAVPIAGLLALLLLSMRRIYAPVER